MAVLRSLADLFRAQRALLRTHTRSHSGSMEERETFEDGATRTAMAAHEEWARDHPEQARVMQAERAVMLRQQHAEQAEAQAQLLQQQLFVQQQMLAQQTAQLQAAQLQLQAQLQQQGEQQKLLVARTSSASEQQPPDAGPRERRGSLQALEQIQKLAAAQALQEKGKVDFATAVQASAMFTFGVRGAAPRATDPRPDTRGARWWARPRSLWCATGWTTRKRAPARATSRPR
jgi:hypothetical protein